ncbi:hypothetical protein [Actinopolymorpha pittospori]|uniref:Membrane protein n=1 Tax=Actinopolymorpha pittospori TaxID=648752 RepID=A0A927MV36_9ACTN|nr:hypothetical protein [Actinopolymorpha pittospori]MBE1607431.1 putative membrane protein [Actinopolymorpha pittospori]
MSPSTYRFLVAVHLIVSVAWLGIVAAKLVLGIAAVSSVATVVAMARFTAMDVLNIAFRPLAVATVVTGVALSLGTKWGLLRHYWVATKLALTVGVIGTAVLLADRLAQAAQAATGTTRGSAGAVAGGDPILDLATAPTTLLLGLSVAHLAMLVLATVLSVYKPWGKTRLGRWPTELPAPRGSLDVGGAERPSRGASSLVP